MDRFVKIDGNTIYEYDIECLNKNKKSNTTNDDHSSSNLFELLFCLKFMKQ